MTIRAKSQRYRVHAFLDWVRIRRTEKRQRIPEVSHLDNPGGVGVVKG